MSKITLKLVQLSSHKEDHTHEYIQILFPIEGIIFLQSGTSEFVLDDKSLAIIPAHKIHNYNSHTDNKVLLLNIPKHIVKEADAKRLSDITHFFVTEKIEYVRTLFMLETENPTTASAADYLFYYLYDLLLSKSVEVSIHYIHQNYETDIFVSYLAKLEHYNENYYREWFKKKTGLSPTEYIQRLRIEKAKELLISTRYSVCDIAYHVGFKHNSSFTRSFKEITLLSPSEYRKTYAS